MENGTLTANDIAIGGLLAGNRGGGYGYGGGGGAWGGGGNGGAGPWANPSANAVRLNRNAQMAENQADCTRDAMREGLRTIENSFESGERSSQFTAIAKAIADTEARTIAATTAIQLDALRSTADTNKALADCCCATQLGFKDVAAEMAACCCETQKLVISDGQKTRDLIQDNALRAAESTNNINATVGPLSQMMAAQTAAIVAAIGNIGHHSR